VSGPNLFKTAHAAATGAFLCAVLWTGGAAADVGADLEAVLNERSYQTELPDPPEPREIDVETPDFDPVPDGTLNAFELIGSFFLICLIAFAVVVLTREVSRFLDRRRRAPSGVGKAAPSATRRPVIDRAMGGDALARADALAAQGNIAEAIALLLRTGIQTLSRRAEAETDASRTSREILGLAPLAPPSREAFGDLIRAQEHAHFAARPADLALFERCRASFERFVAAENAGTTR
jgi:hypothetical protein